MITMTKLWMCRAKFSVLASDGAKGKRGPTRKADDPDEMAGAAASRRMCLNRAIREIQQKQHIWKRPARFKCGPGNIARALVDVGIDNQTLC